MSNSPSPTGSDTERNNFEEITSPNEELNIKPNDDKKYDDIDDFDNNLPETVTLLRGPYGSKVYIVGTAHFSEESQNDVATVIQKVQPHIVMVELCTSRINILQLDDKTLLEEAKNINMEKITNSIKLNGVFNGLMYIMLLTMSAHLTKELGMAPGGEFRRAFTEARKVKNCVIQLGDRPIQITIQRALAKLSWWQTFKLGWHLMTSKDPISKEDVENCKQRDMLEELLAEMTGEFPALGQVFVHERDVFLTRSLQNAALPQIDRSNKFQSMKVVGVVGIGHVPGIIKLWPHTQEVNIAEIMSIPPPTLTSKLIRISFKLSMVSLGGFLMYKYVPGTKTVTHSFCNACNSAFQNIVKYTKSN